MSTALILVIPFLLNMVMPGNEQRGKDFVYVFDVRMQTKYFVLTNSTAKCGALDATNGTELAALDLTNNTEALKVQNDTECKGANATNNTIIKNKDALMTSMRCRLLSPSELQCVIGKVGRYYMLEDNKKLYMPTNKFTVPPVIQERIPFVITFNSNGTVRYPDMPDNSRDKKFLSDMYRMIGDQLTLGTDILNTSKEAYFSERESSFIGECLTFYQVYRQSGHNVSHYLLRQEFQAMGDNRLYELRPNETLHISKWRYLDDCSSLRDYIMGRKFWPTLIPKNLTTRMNESSSLMSFTKHSFTSRSKRTFEIYNENKKLPGLVSETVLVKLLMVETEEKSN